jgi:hypothetical protein
VLAESLGDECSLEIITSLQAKMAAKAEDNEADGSKEILRISIEDVEEMLTDKGVSAEKIKEFVKSQDAEAAAKAEEDEFYVPAGVHTVADDSGKSVTITTTMGASIKAGDTITLRSKLIGFEDCTEILYVWRVDKGNGFETVPDSNSDTYSFQATAESLRWNWRLDVYYR